MFGFLSESCWCHIATRYGDETLWIRVEKAGKTSINSGCFIAKCNIYIYNIIYIYIIIYKIIYKIIYIYIVDCRRVIPGLGVLGCLVPTSSNTCSNARWSHLLGSVLAPSRLWFSLRYTRGYHPKYIPSGKLTVCYWTWPIFIVALPIY